MPSSMSHESARNPLKRLSSKLVSANPSKRAKPSPPPPPPNPFESTIKVSNALSVTQLQDLYFPAQYASFTAKDGRKFRLTTHTPSTIDPDELEQCYNLVEETSGADYNASGGGWNPVHKREEMREADMRYILLRPSDPEGPGSTSTQDSKPAPISAFISFMLTLEEEQPVIYIYEIHTKLPVRGVGLGKHMMDLIETIGRNVGMWKSMLTVFTRNRNAEGLYRRLGYVVDEMGPQERKLRGGKVKRPEYFIMSKELQKEL